jgi:hypothetical protein
MNASGRCLCGAVTFEAGGVERDVHGCHCNMCRQWSGGPSLGVSVAQVNLSGAENIATYDSSAWAERGFRTRCGSNLFSSLKEANHYILFMGSFDDQTPFNLSGEIYFDEKPAGYDFAGEHPRMTGAEFLASLQQP